MGGTTTTTEKQNRLEKKKDAEQVDGGMLKGEGASVTLPGPFKGGTYGDLSCPPSEGALLAEVVAALPKASSSQPSATHAATVEALPWPFDRAYRERGSKAAWFPPSHSLPAARPPNRSPLRTAPSPADDSGAWTPRAGGGDDCVPVPSRTAAARREKRPKHSRFRGSGGGTWRVPSLLPLDGATRQMP